MSFLHSGIALAAVAAIALPIVIHLLFRRRRVPLDWAAMDLLREAVRRTNRRLRFEQWLLLALRSLALLALGLGLAVPMLGKSGVFGDAPRTWIVVVDEGTTSALRIGAESELARVRAEALRLIEARGAQDRVGIVLASTPPRLLLAPTGDSERIVRELNAIAPSESPSDLTAALRLAYGAIEADARGSGGSGLGTSARSDGRVVIASAFRAGSLGSRETVASVPAAGDAAESAVAARDVEAERDETGATPRTELIALAPARESPTDVRIASIEVRPAPTGGSAAVRVLLARQGASLEEGKTGLRVEGAGFAPAPVRTVAWERGQSEATVEVQLTSAGVGEATGNRSVIEARIDDDALAPGNVASAIIDARDDVEVGVVGRRGALEAADLDSVPASLWVSRALSPAVGSGMRVREIDPSSCDARALLGLDAIVIARPDLLSQQSCDALGAFVRSGGIAIVLPSGESRAQTWGSTLLPRLGVTMRVGSEAVEFAEARTFAGEQPAHRILASIRPELPMLLEPVAVSRAVPIEGFEADEVLLAFEGGQPFAVAQSPRPEGRSQGARTEGDRNAPDPRRDVPGGLVVLMASSPELSWTNLPVKPFMVPFFGELVRATLQVLGGAEPRGGRRARVRRAGPAAHGARWLRDGVGRGRRKP